MFRFSILLLLVSAVYAETVYVQPRNAVVVAGSTQQTQAYVYTDTSGNVVYVPARVIHTPPVTISQPVVVQQPVIAHQPVVVQQPAAQRVYVQPRRYIPAVNDHYNTRHMYRRPCTHRRSSGRVRVSLRLPSIRVRIRH